MNDRTACAACRYYAERSAPYSHEQRIAARPPEYPEESVSRFEHPGYGDCRRRAPNVNLERRHPTVRGDHWCGEFKGRE